MGQPSAHGLTDSLAAEAWRDPVLRAKPADQPVWPDAVWLPSQLLTRMAEGGASTAAPYPGQAPERAGLALARCAGRRKDLRPQPSALGGGASPAPRLIPPLFATTIIDALDRAHHREVLPPPRLRSTGPARGRRPRRWTRAASRCGSMNLLGLRRYDPVHADAHALVARRTRNPALPAPMQLALLTREGAAGRHARSCAVPLGGSARHRPRSGWPTTSPGPRCCPTRPFSPRRRPRATISRRWGTASALRWSRWRTGSPRSSAPGRRACPSSSSGWTRPGTITSATRPLRLHVRAFTGAPARSGTCHRAFETPGRFLRQWRKRPMARATSASRATSPSPAVPGGRRPGAFAIGSAARFAHAGALVYADHMEVANPAAFEPIGISCRICERLACHQRAVPPMERPPGDRRQHARRSALRDRAVSGGGGGKRRAEAPARGRSRMARSGRGGRTLCAPFRPVGRRKRHADAAGLGAAPRSWPWAGPRRGGAGRRLGCVSGLDRQQAVDSSRRFIRVLRSSFSWIGGSPAPRSSRPGARRGFDLVVLVGEASEMRVWSASAGAIFSALFREGRGQFVRGVGHSRLSCVRPVAGNATGRRACGGLTG